MTRQDPYAWLRADNWQEVMQAPAALPATTSAEPISRPKNGYFAVAFEAPRAELIETIYREIRGRIEEDESGIPTPDGPWSYNSRMLEGEQYPQIVRTPRGPAAAGMVLLDCNVEAGESYFGFGGADHSPDHTLLAWAADRQGSEYYTIHIRDLATGKDTGETISEAADEGVWSADGHAIYYTEFDDSHRPFRVRRHQLGTPQAADEIVFEEADPGFFVSVGETLDRRFVTIDVHDHQTSETWLIAAGGEGTPRLVSARLAEREYDIESHGDVLYVLTNADRAEDFKIVDGAGRLRSATRRTGREPGRRTCRGC